MSETVLAGPMDSSQTPGSDARFCPGRWVQKALPRVLAHRSCATMLHLTRWIAAMHALARSTEEAARGFLDRNRHDGLQTRQHICSTDP